MIEMVKTADFWYALAVTLICAIAVLGGKHRLKKYIIPKKGNGKNDTDNAEN